MEPDWTENLIVTIEKRPALYDKRKKEYSDRNAKDKLWQEVYSTLVPNWSTLTSEEKLRKGKEIQNKWQNLRTCFKRELRLQKKKKSGDGQVKRRKYIYYDLLLFLLPTIEDRETVTDIEPIENEDDQIEDIDDAGLDDSARSESPVTNKQAVPSVKRVKKSKASYEESLLKILEKKCNDQEIDEDKSFLLSLVPSFKKLTDDQKFQVKMDFLSILQKVQVPSSNIPPPPAPAYNQPSTSMQNPAPNYEYHYTQTVPPTQHYYMNNQMPSNTQPDYSRSSSSCSYTATSFLSPNDQDTVEDIQVPVMYDMH